MKYIVMDLEMNPLDGKHKAEKEICRNEIIEIGAIALDDNFEKIDKFVTFVKPQLNVRIESRVEKLTGIQTDMVQASPCFEEAVNQFLVWCASIQDDFQIIQWSENDKEQFFKELFLKNTHLSAHQQAMLSSWHDLQKEYGERLGLERLISLKESLMLAGVDGIGRQHDALFDAENTAILFRTIRIPELYDKALKRVENALETKTVSMTIGEMFDFSQFELTA